MPALVAAQESQEISVFDVEQHPESPRHSTIYPEAKIPLDTQLSWTNRFKGNEDFNEAETLAANGMASDESESMHSGEMSHDPAKCHEEMHGVNIEGKTCESCHQGQDMEAMSKMSHDGHKCDGKMEGMSHGAHQGMDGMGVVKTIRAEQGKVKIQHGPIDKFGMPEMTMMFKVTDPAMLKGLEKGDEVGFNVDNSSGGFVVTKIMTMAMMKEMHDTSAGTESDPGADAMDASGIVKTIRAEQGKVKIEHGPIDKFGMPAMTMVFKLQNPADLEKLEKGMAVEFDVDNSSGGFEIIRINPVKQ